MKTPIHARLVLVVPLVTAGLLSHAAPPAKTAAPAAPPSKSAAPPSKSAPAGGGEAGGGMEIDIGLGEETNAINIEVVDVNKQAFDKAQTQMGNEDYAGAAVAFHLLLKEPKAKAYHEQAEYLLAKALYRLGFYHAGLNRFVKVLEKGDKHKYYKTSKEWLFFISRKTVDQGIVVEEIARYASQDLPEKYADEFYFLLAQLYFNKSVEQELTTGEDAVPPAEGEGEMEFDSNDVGGGGGAGGDAPARVRVPGSAGDDGFDFGLDDLDDGKNKKKGKEKPGVKDGKSKGKPGDVKQPAEEPAKPEEKKDEGGLEFGVDDATKPVPAEEKPKEQPAEAGEKKPAEAAPAPKQRKLVADQKEALEKCVENASKVKETSPLYLKSVFLRGSCLYAMAEFEKSVAAYKDVIKLTKAGKWKNHPLREEAFFTLARVHYEFQQFRAAIFYYNKISRDSPAWLDSLFESSWAYFRLADYEKALGNMVTIQAPFFTEEYFPEALILKAVTYYENCRYPEALGVLGEFEGQYGPLRDELDRLTKDAKTPEDYYALLKTLENSKNATALTKRLSKVARKDQNLSLKAVSARELETEEQKIQKSAGLKDSELQKELLTLVQKRREEVVKSAGAIARAKLEAERDELKSLSSQLFRIKFEVIKREKEGLEASLRGEKQGSKLGGYRYSTAVADTELYWPFDGEYWRDELGTYEYTLSKGCRQ